MKIPMFCLNTTTWTSNAELTLTVYTATVGKNVADLSLTHSSPEDTKVKVKAKEKEGKDTRLTVSSLERCDTKCIFKPEVGAWHGSESTCAVGFERATIGKGLAFLFSRCSANITSATLSCTMSSPWQPLFWNNFLCVCCANIIQRTSHGGYFPDSRCKGNACHHSKHISYES